MKRILVVLCLACALLLGAAASAYAATTAASVTESGGIVTATMATAGGLDRTVCVKVYSGATLIRSFSTTLQRSVTKTWSTDGDEPGYVYTYGPYRATFALDAATISAWRAGTRGVKLSVYEWEVGRQLVPLQLVYLHDGLYGPGVWLRQHPTSVKNNGAAPCFECHQETYCANCHVGG
ncbi:MAG TPA: hypothetical protein VFG89_09625 [Coriobacteriia bacterium]|nr:hypothetical protein [Coriobacteriia bacterium]